MKGDEINPIQEALQKMDINIGNNGIDGVFGNDGHNAVMTFQENYKPSHITHQRYSTPIRDHNTPALNILSCSSTTALRYP